MIMLIQPNGTELDLTKTISFSIMGHSSSRRLVEHWLQCDESSDFTFLGRNGIPAKQFFIDEDSWFARVPANHRATQLYRTALAADPRGAEPLDWGNELHGNVIILTEPHLLT